MCEVSWNSYVRGAVASNARLTRWSNQSFKNRPTEVSPNAAGKVLFPPESAPSSLLLSCLRDWQDPKVRAFSALLLGAVFRLSLDFAGDNASSVEAYKEGLLGVCLLLLGVSPGFQLSKWTRTDDERERAGATG